MRNKNKIVAAAMVLAFIAGSIAACRIATKSNVDVEPTAGVTDAPSVTLTATAALTEAPDVISTPEPTATSEPTEAPTATPEPTSTPVPTEAPTATPEPTAVPTFTPGPTATPEPTATVAPTVTPAPTATPKPKVTATPAPTATPKATATPKPTVTPKPTATPKPEKKYEASADGIKEFSADLLTNDYLVCAWCDDKDFALEHINKMFYGDGPFASISTEDIALQVSDAYNDFSLAGLPEEMMDDFVQQHPLHSELGTFRNYVAWMAVQVGDWTNHETDTTGYKEAEYAGFKFRSFNNSRNEKVKVGKVYEESVIVSGYPDGSEDLLSCGEFEFYKASEKMYYDEDSKNCMHIDITHVIEAFDNDELGAYYLDNHREEYGGEMRLVTDGEAYCTTSGNMAYLQFNKPGYYRITTVVTNNVTGEDLGTGLWLSYSYVHVIE